MATAKSAAFTVIELMVVVSILGLLVAISMSAFSSAVAQAKISRTKAVIAKLDQLVMDRYESYRTRPIPINVARTGNAATYVDRTDPRFARMASERRLYALREIMRMEMPNTRADVNDAPVLVSRTSINRGYQRRVPTGWSNTWEQAECLYLIIASLRDGDKSALDFFSKEEIGDLDNDGVPEILDAWGVPIQFILWAPGYLNDTASFPALTMQDQTTPDSFDLLKADPRWNPTTGSTLKPYDLKPLIFSYGPDKVTSGVTLPAFGYSTTMPYRNDPYYKPMTPNYFAGQIPDSAGATATADNITNHYQEAE